MTYTLTTLRDQVEQVLNDTTNAVFTTGEIDAAIRRALADLTAYAPARAIATLTLAASGREINLASLATLITVERVWWEYTSASPEYPPRWRDFEQWAGPLLWINDGAEPATGDVLRIFYTAAHTLTGLDAAAVTTLPDDQAQLVVTGAAGYAAQSRSLEVSGTLNVDGWVAQRIADYADLTLRAFYAGLKALARRHAAAAAGIAPAPALDRWDTGEW
jgi:hypothetical protein